MAEIAERYADLFDYAPVGLFLLDEDYRVIEANLAGLEMLGRERAEVLGRGFSGAGCLPVAARFTDCAA